MGEGTTARTSDGGRFGVVAGCGRDEAAGRRTPVNGRHSARNSYAPADVSAQAIPPPQLFRQRAIQREFSRSPQTRRQLPGGAADDTAVHHPGLGAPGPPVSLVAGADFYVAYASGEEWPALHVATGYAIGGLLIVLHVGGVLVSSLLHRENLGRAMISGRKPTEVA